MNVTVLLIHCMALTISSRRASGSRRTTSKWSDHWCRARPVTVARIAVESQMKMGGCQAEHVPLENITRYVKICLTILSCCDIDVVLVDWCCRLAAASICAKNCSCSSNFKFQFRQLVVSLLASIVLSIHHDDVGVHDSLCVDRDQSWMVSLQFACLSQFIDEGNLAHWNLSLFLFCALVASL